MAAIFRDNPNIYVKLATASIALSTAAAKLYAHQFNLISDIKKDVEFIEELKMAYIDSAEDDLYFAEEFLEVSAEVDKLMLELNEENESE